MLHMFNNNTYTDFRIANKRILIPSYVVRVILQKQNVTKLNCIYVIKNISKLKV